MQLETTNFGKIAYLHSLCAQRQLSVQISSHLPQLPPTLPNYEKWEYWGSGNWKGPIFVQLGVDTDVGYSN